MKFETRFCTHCATALEWIEAAEDGGPKQRLRCPACGWTHWNNPVPVLAAVIECADREGRVLLARNAAWPGRMFALVTGFMEAGETPEEGIRREVAEETALEVDALSLIGVYDFQRMNQVIIAYHALAREEGLFAGISAAGACKVALQVAEQVENATIVFLVCDRGDRYLSTGVFPA